MQPESAQFSYALGVALASALGSAVGIIGLLVKWMIDTRRQRNGHGHVTRDEFTDRLTAIRLQIDDKTLGIKDSIEDLHEDQRRQIEMIREDQRRLRDEINVVIGRLDTRLVRLEDGRIIDQRRASQ